MSDYIIRGDRLSELRKSRNLTQKDLAENLQLGEKEIWRYENVPSNPTGLTLTKLARYFSVTTDYLLGLDDSPNRQNGRPLTEKESAVLSAIREDDLKTALKALVGE